MRSSACIYAQQRVVKLLTLILIVIGTIFPVALDAQPELPRISVA